MSDDLEHEDAERANSAKNEKDRRDQVKRDLEWIMGAKQGRRFIARLLASTGVDMPVFNSNGSTMTHAEGRRSIGVELTIELKAQHRDAYLRMLAEILPEAKS
ncbi:MAG TPA: hypothetical protein DCS97_10875 [Planctomycetes bacterium]|nr:hypothetical protein [Planctomycetota bacterium]